MPLPPDILKPLNDAYDAAVKARDDAAAHWQDENRLRVAAESDLAAVRADRDAQLAIVKAQAAEIAKLKGQDGPVVNPGPGPETPTTGSIPTGPVNLPANSKIVTLTQWLSIKGPSDAGGKTYAIGKGQKLLVPSGGVLSNARIIASTKEEVGAVQLEGGTLQTVAFADGNFLAEVKGDGSKLLNVSFGNVDDYAFFFKDATNILIDGMYGKGASKNQSLVRFGTDRLDACTGTVRNVYLEFVGTAGKVTMRGNFRGVFEHGYIKGHTFGMNPQYNDDEFMGHGRTVWLVNGFPRKAVNTAEVLRAYNDASGDVKAKSAAAMKVAYYIENGAKVPIKGDIDATFAARKVLGARRSDITFRDWSWESSPLFWAAGTRYDIHGGKTIGDTIWEKPVNQVPTPEYHVDGDIDRPIGDVTYSDGHDFVTNRTAAELKSLAAKYGVKLVNCTRNGVAL